MKKKLSNFTLILISIFLLFFFIEILLRFVGASFSWVQDQKNKQSVIKDTYRILCVGESTTALGGENSYPSQLESLLNAKSSPLRFKVINKGVPGLGSTYIVDHLKQWLIEYRPHMMIVMMGINDGNDRIPLDDIRRQQKDFSSFFVNLRLYKLSRWIYLGLNQRYFASSPEIAKQKAPDENKTRIGPRLVVLAEKTLLNKQYADAERVFLYIEQKGSPIENWQARLKLHEIYFATDNMPALLEMVNRNPLEPVNVDVSMRLCKEKKYINQVMFLLNKHLQESKDKWQWYNLMFGCFAYAGEKEKADVFIELAKKTGLLGMSSITYENYKRLMALLSEWPVEAVIMQYPLRSVSVLESALSGYGKDILWVDNTRNFQEVLKVKGYDALFTDRFAGDFGHCTPLGNKLIAENLSEIILNKLKNY